MARPHLTFDGDGTPRVHIPVGDRGNTASVACSVEGLAEFIGEVKDAVIQRGNDPELQRKVGKSLIDILGKWARS